MLTYLRAQQALVVEHAPATARRLAADGLAVARAHGAVDGEMVLLALSGLARVTEGDVVAGMRELDEATTAALAGEVADARLVQIICCHLINACQLVRDLDRAGEWCARVEEMATRFDDPDIFAACRTQYGEVLLWRGAWPEAERALTAVCRDFAQASVRVDALVRLAELRRRQGRPEEAHALAEEARDHPRAALVRAALALDAGDAGEAAAEAERHLRRLAPDDRMERVPALELLVQARLALGEREPARAAAAELAASAASAATPALAAAAKLAEARVAASPDLACPALEDAVDLFRGAGARYEAARAELELASVLSALGRAAAAQRAAAVARAGLEALGLPAPALLAAGRSNDDIAAELVLSVRTVESHVAHIYEKVGLSGRTARAAATAYALANGLA